MITACSYNTEFVTLCWLDPLKAKEHLECEKNFIISKQLVASMFSILAVLCSESILEDLGRYRGPHISTANLNQCKC